MTKGKWKRPDPEVRFFQKVEKTSSCWIWTGAKAGNDYGVFWADNRRVKAHRWAYEHFVGPIPDGYVIDHFKCFRHDCVNPSHLRTVPQLDNNHNREGANAGSMSGVRNVWWNRSVGKYQVELMVEGRTVYGGRYPTLREAECVAESMRLDLMPGIPRGEMDFTKAMIEPIRCSGFSERSGRQCKRVTVGANGRCHWHQQR